MANCTPWNAIFPKRGCYPNSIKSGVSPQMSDPSNTDSNRELNRMILRNVWQTAPQGTLANKVGPGYRGRWANSSFRIVNNAGDVLSRQNYSCGGANMVGSHPGMLNLTYGGGQSKKQCDGTGIPPSTCNVKYVYDSSDFIRYRKLKALNASYVAPDYTDGGANGLGNKNVKYSYDEVLNISKAPYTEKFFISSYSNGLQLIGWTPDYLKVKDFIGKLKELGIKDLSLPTTGFNITGSTNLDIELMASVGNTLLSEIIESVIQNQRQIDLATGVARENAHLIISLSKDADLGPTATDKAEAGWYQIEITGVNNPGGPTINYSTSTATYESWIEHYETSNSGEQALTGGGTDLYFLGQL